MISHINLKILFSNIILKSYNFLLWKYLRVFYFLLWWNLKNLYVKNFKIFLKKYENKFNMFKNFFLFNNSYLLKKISYSTNFNLFLLQYLNTQLIYLLKKNKNNTLLNLYLSDDSIFFNQNLFYITYNIYYNFYKLFYLNKCY